MTDPRSFGFWLQRERERREITLRSIADRTKIGAGLLESLERGDVSRWPGGIYRRSFMRSYAEAIGLDPDLVLANFERLFPDPDALAPLHRLDAAPISAAPAADTRGELRLQMAPRVWPSAPLVRTAVTDVGVALCAGLVGLLVLGTSGFWSATAIAALALHVCSVLGFRRAIGVPLANAMQRLAAPRVRDQAAAAERAEIPVAEADAPLDLTLLNVQ
jgi:transcriptional regulator with XRE-family HTH domain